MQMRYSQKWFLLCSLNRISCVYGEDWKIKEIEKGRKGKGVEELFNDSFYLIEAKILRKLFF